MKMESADYRNNRILLLIKVFVFIIPLCLCSIVLAQNVKAYEKNLEDITFADWDHVTAVNIGPDYKMNDTRYTGINELCNFHFLSYIKVDTRNEELASYDGVLYNKDKTVMMCFPQGLHRASIPKTCTGITPDALYGTSRSVRNQVKRIITRNNKGVWPGYKEYVNPLNQKKTEDEEEQ